MPGTFLLSGGFPGRKRRAFHPAKSGEKRQRMKKTIENHSPGRGVKRKRTPGRNAPPGAVSMLRFEYTYTLNTSDTKNTANIYCTINARYFPCVYCFICYIMRIRNIKNTRYCIYVLNTKTTTNTSKERTVKNNESERD